MKTFDTQSRRKKVSPGSLSSRTLLVIDQRPIKKKALTKFQAAYRSYLKTKKEIDHHILIVRPSYYNWLESMTKDFNKILADLSEQLRKKSVFLEWMESLMERAYLSPKMAFKAVQEAIRKEEAEQEQKFNGQEEFKFYSDEQNERKREEYRDTRNGRHRSHNYYWESILDEGLTRKQKVQLKLEKIKIKSVYRKLVRLLHPDSSILLSNALVKELWAEVAKAYKEQDLEALEILYVLARILSDPEAEDFGLSDLQKATAFIANKTKVLRSEKRELMESDPSWQFEKEDRDYLADLILDDLQSEERRLKRRLKEVEKRIKEYKKEEEWVLPRSRRVNRKADFWSLWG